MSPRCCHEGVSGRRDVLCHGEVFLVKHRLLLLILCRPGVAVFVLIEQDR